MHFATLARPHSIAAGGTATLQEARKKCPPRAISAAAAIVVEVVSMYGSQVEGLMEQSLNIGGRVSAGRSQRGERNSRKTREPLPHMVARRDFASAMSGPPKNVQSLHAASLQGLLRRIQEVHKNKQGTHRRDRELAKRSCVKLDTANLLITESGRLVCRKRDLAHNSC